MKAYVEISRRVFTWRRAAHLCLLFAGRDWLNARLPATDTPRMSVKNFESPASRLGFVVFCFSSALCLVAFVVTYESFHDVSFYRLAYLIFDRSIHWQQTAFKIGLAGVVVGAALAWDFLSFAKRVYDWIKKG